jgi:hypothetical protein
MFFEDALWEYIYIYIYKQIGIISTTRKKTLTRCDYNYKNKWVSRGSCELPITNE